ncbi:MAG: lactate racemase domain-containing protein [Gemmatales bacterium]|nr:lactate racemase domain-containing protein [Gemmatales bacterium]MDW7993070.1 lactate racemase domain-containing protein [Gemmatales bacterium]
MSERVAVALDYGQTQARFWVSEECLTRPMPPWPQANELSDVRAAVRQALESPIDFPPLRQALTPDDALAIVVHEQYRSLPDLLVPLLEHVEQAGVSLERVTLLCPPRLPEVAPPPWREELPEKCAAIRVEEHEPTNRARLCYLAGTRAGRRLYLNRTLVEADQVIVVGPACYDPVMGYGGGRAALFPALADETVRREFARGLVEGPPTIRGNRRLEESGEVSWLLGVPFWLAAIPGRGDRVHAVLAGPEGSIAPRVWQMLESVQQYRFAYRAEVVVTALSGEPRWLSFDDLTRALAAAARVVQPGGKIIALAPINAATLGPAARQLGQFDDLVTLLAQARRDYLADWQSIWHLAVAQRRASLFVYGSLPEELVLQMHATPIRSLEEIQRILDHCESCIFLPDGHRSNPIIMGTRSAYSQADPDRTTTS